MTEALRQRLAALLMAPDPPELQRRGHHVTAIGDPRRRQTVFLPLQVRWAQRRYLAIDPPPAIAPARVVGVSPCRKVVGFDQERARRRMPFGSAL